MIKISQSLLITLVVLVTQQNCHLRSTDTNPVAIITPVELKKIYDNAQSELNDKLILDLEYKASLLNNPIFIEKINKLLLDAINKGKDSVVYRLETNDDLDAIEFFLQKRGFRTEYDVYAYPNSPIVISWNLH